MSAIQQWPIPDWLLAHPMVDYARHLARKYKDRPVEDILRIYIQYADRTAVEAEFDHLFELLKPLNFTGRGVEVGAGVGIFSAMVARRYPQVTSIDAVEVVPEVVEFLQTAVTAHVCPERPQAVVPVIGSFDDLQVADGSYDFCLELGALHHSGDLDKTLAEIARVMRPGGLLVALDRAHNNRLCEDQRRFMLDVEYSAAWLEANGFPPGRLTREQNGEHEIRLCEWDAAFTKAGFRLERRLELRPVSWRHFFRSCLLALPFSLRRQLNWLPSRVREHKGETWWRLKERLGLATKEQLFHPAIRDKTVFVLRKLG